MASRRASLGVEHLMRYRPESRNSSRSSSVSDSSSNRGSISRSEYSEGEDQVVSEPEEENLHHSASVCNSCAEENHVQQALSVRQARQRSYLHGSVGPFQSLLGNSELKRTLCDGQLKVFIGTWNMNGKTPPTILDDLLLPSSLQRMPDLVAIGTQESSGHREEWEISLQETLGPGHVLFHSIEFGTLHLAIFLRRDLIWVCSVPESDSLSTRAASAFRTKGGVAIGFSIFGTSLLFLNCHLTAHAEKFKERERDLKKIFHSLDLPKELPVRKKHRDVTNNYDVVFLCGDLNFRLTRTREQVIESVAKNWNPQKTQLVSPHSHHYHMQYLLESDQLKQSLQQNRLLRRFEEATIRFAPTYKYTVGSYELDDSAKERVPSYTDRVLWKQRKEGLVQCRHYDSVPQFLSSDHFPVWADFQVQLKPGRETVPLSGGTFNRSIYLEGMRRRVQAWDPNKPSTSSTHSCALQ